MELTGIENRATLARVTCGWTRAHLPLELVRRYWRDVHSPAIARRAGVYDYRHFALELVDASILGPVAGVGMECDPAARLMWISDVRYADQAGLDAFGRSPEGEVKSHMLADIEMIVDRSTTYLVVGQNAQTVCDVTEEASPQGPVKQPTYSVFFRARGGQDAFRGALRQLAARWAATLGVRRVRMNLFETPDMEAERAAGYPIKTHPAEQQYQAWFELVLEDAAIGQTLLPRWVAAEIAEIHVYPVSTVTTFNYGGRPTLTGLRGYAAYEAIAAFDAGQQRQASLLEWMYGPVVAGGPLG